ncbi:hypothetical protein Bca101_087159 [Brassica carinata]
MDTRQVSEIDKMRREVWNRRRSRRTIQGEVAYPYKVSVAFSPRKNPDGEFSESCRVLNQKLSHDYDGDHD